MYIYEVRPRRDNRGVDLISDVLPFGRLWYGEPNAISNAIGYAEHFSRSHPAVIRVYDEAGSVIETQEHKPSGQRFRNKSSRAGSGAEKRLFCRRSAREAGHARQTPPNG
jgi:hypothetical protein